MFNLTLKIPHHLTVHGIHPSSAITEPNFRSHSGKRPKWRWTTMATLAADAGPFCGPFGLRNYNFGQGRWKWGIKKIQKCFWLCFLISYVRGFAKNNGSVWQFLHVLLFQTICRRMCPNSSVSGLMAKFTARQDRQKFCNHTLAHFHVFQLPVGIVIH